jgi:hypothetical protein
MHNMDWEIALDRLFAPYGYFDYRLLRLLLLPRIQIAFHGGVTAAADAFLHLKIVGSVPLACN